MKPPKMVDVLCGSLTLLLAVLAGVALKGCGGQGVVHGANLRDYECVETVTDDGRWCLLWVCGSDISNE